MIASDPFIFPRSLSSHDSSKIKHAVIAISVFLLRAYLCSILGIRSDKEEWKQEKAKERKKNGRDPLPWISSPFPLGEEEGRNNILWTERLLCAATFREYWITLEERIIESWAGFAPRREMEIKMHRVVHDERGPAWIIGMKIERAEANGWNHSRTDKKPQVTIPGGLLARIGRRSSTRRESDVRVERIGKKGPEGDSSKRLHFPFHRDRTFQSASFVPSHVSSPPQWRILDLENGYTVLYSLFFLERNPRHVGFWQWQLTRYIKMSTSVINMPTRIIISIIVNPTDSWFLWTIKGKKTQIEIHIRIFLRSMDFFHSFEFA